MPPGLLPVCLRKQLSCHNAITDNESHFSMTSSAQEIKVSELVRPIALGFDLTCVNARKYKIVNLG